MPTTKHGKRRAQQRAGITAGNIDKMTKRIFKHGIKHSECNGELKKFMDYFYLKEKNINNTRLYGNSFYLFHNNVLITTIPVPQNIINNIEDYIDANAWEKYCIFKENKRKHRNTKNKIICRGEEDSFDVRI